MGSPVSDFDPVRDETPHEVTVPDFFLGRYPVTQAQWRVVAAFPQVNINLKPEPSYFKGDNLPVERIAWYEAVEFCDRLSRFVDNRLSADSICSYRLPSEAEWEYACRAGTTTPFYFGKTISTEVANYKGAYNGDRTYDNPYEGDYRQTTTPVDCFKVANAFGLSDMHGNVWEWCQDHYGDYAQAPTNGSARITGKETAKRVLRGGSWADCPKMCRSAYRFNSLPENVDFRDGFRVSRSISKPQSASEIK
ncbi:conserved domain protein [Synechococcus sp. PCC 7335]|nr:conserved domain protein [Synechococcus sp. PCC 7335]